MIWFFVIAFDFIAILWFLWYVVWCLHSHVTDVMVTIDRKLETRDPGSDSVGRIGPNGEPMVGAVCTKDVTIIVILSISQTIIDIACQSREAVIQYSFCSNCEVS